MNKNIDTSLEEFWLFAKAHRSGDAGAILYIEMIAEETGRAAQLAKVYLHEFTRKRCNSQDENGAN